jgi:hypothetical protein
VPDIFDINRLPRDEAIVFGLTRRGLCSEVNCLALGYAYAMITRRHLYVEELAFSPGWSDLFDVRLATAADMPSGYREVLRIPGGGPNFREMRLFCRSLQGTRVTAEELEFEGPFEDLFFLLAARLARPVQPIVEHADRLTGEAPFAAIHMRRGDKVNGPRHLARPTVIEGEAYDFDDYLGQLELHGPDLEDLFVLTDDYRVLEKIHGRGYRVRSLCLPGERGYYQEVHEQKSPEQRYAESSRFLAELLVATRSQAFGGVYRSNVSRLIYALHPHKQRCFSVDSLPTWCEPPPPVLNKRYSVQRDDSED